jgi:PAS domain S-box-containing protein
VCADFKSLLIKNALDEQNTMLGIKKIPLICLPILLLLSCLFFEGALAQQEGAHAQHAPPKKNVLVLHGLWRIRTWEIPFNASLHNEFLADKAVTAGITHVYLGLEDYPDSVYPRKLIEQLRDRVETHPVDLVISILPGADRFLFSYGEELFPGVPKVFAFPGTREIQKLRKLKNAVIIPSAVEKAMPTNVERIYSLLPDTRHLVVVSGDSSLDHNYLKMAKRAIASSKRVTKVSYLVGVPLEELSERVSSLATDTAIFFTTYTEDINGKKEAALDVAFRLAESANAPVFSFHQVLLGTGIIGGHLTTSESYAKTTVAAALRLLKGEPPAAISSKKQIPIDVYDWRALKRWNISEDRLPPGSQVQYKTLTFWETNGRYIIIGITVICLEAILIFALLSSLLRGKRVKATLQENETRYRTLQENVPVGVYRTSNDGKILSVNPAVLKMLGFDAGEDMSSFQVSDFYKNPEIRSDILSHLKAEGEVTDFEAEFRRKDGSLFWGSLSAKRVTDADGNPMFIDGVVQDTSDRKQAELKLFDYQQRLKALASQLTIAEEQERRRIAADLHDYVSQSLALTRLQLAAISKSGDDAGLKKQLDQISLGLLQMSSDIHQLVFELSSPTLRELGLGAAIAEWLEEKITKVSAIEVELIDQLHDGLDEFMSLILFRNVRELLTNTVKHAQANKLVVCLEEAGGAIKITIKDNGIGFNPEHALRKTNCDGGFGLFSVEERMADLDGSLTINSRSHQGATIIMTAPCKPQAGEANRC